MPSCAPNITIREREEWELFTLWTRPQIYTHPAAPPGQQLSRFTDTFRSFQSWFWHTGELISPERTSTTTSPQRKKSLTLKENLKTLLLHSSTWAAQVVRAMSRKKTVKGKGSSKSPKASPSSGRTGKGLAAAAAPSSGLVYPSRPSISNSGEFYDIAFKVSWQWEVLRACIQSSN